MILLSRRSQLAIAAVVDVRMREHHRGDARRIERRLRPVAQPQLLETLEEPAINQQARIARTNQGF